MSLTHANNHLAVKLHQLLAKDEGNVFFSPFSISTAMAMLLCAAEGETESELMTALGYDHAGIQKNEIAMIFEKQISLLLMNQKSYTLSCANSMLIQKDFEVKESYKHMLVESFKALMLQVDFRKEKAKAVNQINEWVNMKTNGMIPNLVNDLDSLSVIVLLNALHFKGTWMRKFMEWRTDPQDFFNKGMENNVKQVDMMHLTETFPFYEDKSMQVLQLPYIGEEVAMLVLLPKAKNGLESVEAGLTPSFLQELKGKLYKEKVKVSLPKFRLEYTKSLVPYFQQLGVSRVFQSGAELGIASDSPELAVSEILHKAVLVVNEEGSEAAAATMVAVMLCAMIMPEPAFVADHPFAFVIYDTRSDLILFMGRVDEL